MRRTQQDVDSAPIHIGDLTIDPARQAFASLLLEPLTCVPKNLTFYSP